MIELNAIAKGRVHGVGFRATTLRVAKELHLSGSVRNLSDGTVEIIAQGERGALEELLSRLQKYFGNQFEVEYVKPEKVYLDFSIS